MHTHRLFVLLAVWLSCPAALAGSEPAGPPVRAERAGESVLLITQAAWTVAEVSFPGLPLAPLTLGPSFPGAQWTLPGAAAGDRLELAWLRPGGAGSTLTLPIEDGDRMAGPSDGPPPESVVPSGCLTREAQR